jgi:hypothetical protein
MPITIHIIGVVIKGEKATQPRFVSFHRFLLLFPHHFHVLWPGLYPARFRHFIYPIRFELP